MVSRNLVNTGWDNGKCCLTASSHYLNKCWLMVSEVWWHGTEDKFGANEPISSFLAALDECAQHKNVTWFRYRTCQFPMLHTLGVDDALFPAGVPLLGVPVGVALTTSGEDFDTAGARTGVKDLATGEALGVVKKRPFALRTCGVLAAGRVGSGGVSGTVDCGEACNGSKQWLYVKTLTPEVSMGHGYVITSHYSLRCHYLSMP